MKILAFDIGTNSVGSAWIDTKQQKIKLAVSVFPAGVEASDSKRGAPKNQKRRQARSQRRSTHRRSKRKRLLRKLLIESKLLPQDPDKFAGLFADENMNPWLLRRDALKRALAPFEFGRILIHLNQRRGALGISIDTEDPEEGKVKDAITALQSELKGRTVGQFMADLYENDVQKIANDETVRNSIRNRRDSFRFHADRGMIRDEFLRIWEFQSAQKGDLANLLTKSLKTKLDNPTSTATWREQGFLFGQRATYWDSGTLGRCDLEPTEHRCPKADMFAQEFLVLEYVNNIKIEKRGEEPRFLDEEERDKVFAALNVQKSATTATIRKALGLHKKAVKAFYDLNIERDKDRKPNTNWFHRSIVDPVFGSQQWKAFDEKTKKSINRAILKFDPSRDEHVEKLTGGCQKWWGLNEEQTENFILGWKTRPKLDNRINLSRKALLNLLPFLREGKSVSEARQGFAEHNAESDLQRDRYALAGRSLSKAERHFMEKHPGLLPPAPTLSNPVVRKAIHEVRRQLNEYLRAPEFGKPDRVVIELARSARQSEKVRNAQLNLNRARNKIRNKIADEFCDSNDSKNQINRVIERVLLCRQQKGVCAYSGETISEAAAAKGIGLEVDHIVPKSRSNDNGANNKVLVRMDANRNKGNQTVKEWLGADSEEFADLKQRLSHIGEGKLAERYFTKGNYKRKWENLNRDAPSIDGFVESQLTDTAYASKEVAAYIREALFHDVPADKRPVLTTKGNYTATLRRDWGLLEGDLERENSQLNDIDEAIHGQPAVVRRRDKDRRDHIHHAVDAVAIAFSTGETIKQLAKIAEAQAQYREEKGRWPRRETIKPPWGTVESFRNQVTDEVKKIVVSHRPVKRKIIGAFHEETQYGPVLPDLPTHRTESHETLFTNRLGAMSLKPNHLRVPEDWDSTWQEMLGEQNKKSQKKLRRQLAQMPDPSPGKSGIVRDRELRARIRDSLRQNGINPDKFTPQQIKLVCEEGKLCMPSGVPIKSAILLRTNTAPVIIPGKVWNHQSRKMVATDDARRQRIYVGGNNHHVAVYEDTKTGNWFGEFVRTFEAAKRVRIENKEAVDRTSNETRRFIFSLSEGETIFARRRDVDANDQNGVGYYVVAKLDATRNRIVFVPHWDARLASDQDRWESTPKGLKSLGPEPDALPFKVGVSALGKVNRRDD